jgi:lauroyl/myristoyl acyltransferase
MHFRPVKDRLARPLHMFVAAVAAMPDGLGRGVMGGIGALARAAYFLPGSHVRRAVGDFCRATGRSDPWAIYSRMVANFQQTALYYGELHRRGPARLIEQTVIDDTLAAQCEPVRQGRHGLILLIPHCVAAVLCGAGISAYAPTALLVRESRSPSRRRLMMSYLEKLGPEVIPSRDVAPSRVARDVMRALGKRKIVVGTTDLIRQEPDSIEARAFGQPVSFPTWPVRFANRYDVPIVASFAHMEGRRVRMLAAEGFRESDLQKSTQRWVTSFEHWFRQYPEDWAFLLDKRWARVLSAAASAARPAAATS